VAEVGKEVYMGGGQIGLTENVVSPRTARELRDRCLGDLGDYWIAVSPSLGPVTPVGSISSPGVDGAPDVATANGVPLGAPRPAPGAARNWRRIIYNLSGHAD
jgi:hypothetical protein